MSEIRVLFVEDSISDSELVRRVLNRSFNLQEFKRVENDADFRAAVASGSWDVILCDFNIPGFSSTEALAFVRQENPHQPFILVSGAIGEEATVEILKGGANDVVLKNNLGRLGYSIERVLRESQSLANEERSRKTADIAIRAREQMLTVVSHDLRNPLGAIQLNAETAKNKLLGAKTLTDAKLATAHIDAVVRSALRMKSLISDVLDKVRLDSGHFVIHRSSRNLSEFILEVEEIFIPLATDKGLTFEAAVLPSDIDAVLDFERLHQILSNLIGNAIKFTPTPGKVIFRVIVHPQELEFQVQDTGPGIDPDHLDKIFQRYWQDQQGSNRGVGLGLSIAKDLVKAHGGRIWVQNNDGQGTCFGFYIPCVWRESLVTKSTTTLGRPRVVYLVDDDDDLREILAENLTELGYLVTTFADGESLVAEFQNSSPVPDVLILDYRLPDMSGGDVLEALRLQKRGLHFPVILLSAEANLLHIADQHKAAAFLSKPLRLRDLSKTIERLFDQPN